MPRFYREIKFNKSLVVVVLVLTVAGLGVWPFEPSLARFLLLAAAVGCGICIWQWTFFISRNLYSSQTRESNEGNAPSKQLEVEMRMFNHQPDETRDRDDS